jgi:hypothetical protein
MKEESGQEGLEAESRFRIWCESRGNTLYDPPNEMNINDHIDFIIYNKKGDRYTVDIKGLKRISRIGNPLQKHHKLPSTEYTKGKGARMRSHWWS